MRTHSGRNIPDPPSDPEQRALWKRMYFTDLYGASKEDIERAMRQPQESRHYRHHRIPMPPKWLLFISHKILAPIGVLASLVYLWEACHR